MLHPLGESIHLWMIFPEISSGYTHRPQHHDIVLQASGSQALTPKCEPRYRNNHDIFLKQENSQMFAQVMYVYHHWSRVIFRALGLNLWSLTKETP